MPWPYAIVACSIGFHVFAGRSRPATSPGKPVFGGVPKPASESICHIVAGGSDSAIFAAPTFDDFWITCSTVSAPVGCASWIVLGPIVSVPGAGLDHRVGPHLARFERRRDRERLQRRAGLEHVGQRAVAHPLARDACCARSGCTSASSRARGSRRSARRGSRARRPSRCSPRPRPSARGTRGTAAARRSTSARSRPACGARIDSTSSTTSPRRLMITRRLPGLPPSHSCCASSMPSWPTSRSPVKPTMWLIISPPG